MSAQNFTAVLLNLDSDVTRLAHMQKQLAQAQIAFSRQSGILADKVPEDLKSFFFDAEGKSKLLMKRGEIGCYASHLLAMKRVASGELGYTVLIMEDDLEIDPNLSEVLYRAQHALPTGWDILRLSCLARRAYVPVARLGPDKFLIRYSKIPNSAGAYLITMNGAQKFLNDGMRGLTFDDDLRRPWFHNLDTYGITPSPIKAGVLHSTIDKIEAGRFNKGMSSRVERTRRGDHFHMARRMRYNIHCLGLANWLACVAINGLDMIFKPLVGQSIIHRAARIFPLKK